MADGKKFEVEPVPGEHPFMVEIRSECTVCRGGKCTRPVECMKLAATKAAG